MSQLAEVLESRGEELVQRWVASVREHLAPGGESHSELEDHIPVFLWQLRATLRGESAEDRTSPEQGTSEVGREHGAQRFRLGFELGALVREYGLLRDLLLDVIAEERLHVSLEEIRLVTNFVATAIAEAVEEHARQQEKARHEEERARSEHLAALFERVPAVVLHVSGPGYVVDLANAAGQRLLGQEPVRGHPLRELVSEATAPGLLALFERVYATGEAQYVPTMRLGSAREPATKRFFDVVAQPTRGAQERVEGVFLHAQEVTEAVLARQQERALQDAEQRLRARTEGERARLDALFQQAPVAIGILRGPQLVIELANPHILRLWGRTREQAMGQPLLEALPEVRGHGFDDLLHGVMATGVPFVATELPVRLARGAGGELETVYFNFVYDVLRDEHGVAEGAIIVATEVTEGVLARQKVEELLRRTQEAELARASVLDALAAQTLVAVCYQRGPEHVFEMANGLYRQLMDREVVGLSPRQVLPEIVEQGFTALLTQVRQSGVPIVARETPVLVSQGQSKPPHEVLFDFTCQPVRQPDGSVDGILTLAMDVTEQVRLRHEAERRAREERELRDFEQHLIGIVSHDLRNPLGAILMGLELLLRRDTLDARTLKSLARLHASTERAVRMVRDLLDFTQARLGGGLRVQREPQDIHAVVRTTVEELRIAYPERELLLEQHGDGAGQWDADRVAQLLGNLLANALKYSPSDTPVTVRCVGGDTDVLLEVHNGGAPIPPAALPRLFEPLQRAVTGGDNTHRSVGLGLYIVDQLVRAHGGDIHVTSTERDGTRFRVRLPRSGGDLSRGTGAPT